MRLSASDGGLAELAEQICTTDTRSKAATVRLGSVTVTGISKGVGMIHPRMATMLAVILTDAVAEPARLEAVLWPIVERTWNQLTVDGDTSTNDTVFLLASGSSGGSQIGADFARGCRSGGTVTGSPAGRRWRGRDDAHQMPGQRRARRCLRTRRRAISRSQQSGQGCGPRT